MKGCVTFVAIPVIREIPEHVWCKFIGNERDGANKKPQLRRELFSGFLYNMTKSRQTSIRYSSI